MNYNGIAECDVLNGTGFRVVLFVSGCEHYCPGCHNQKTWDYRYGYPFTEKTKEYIFNCLDKDYIDGLTITGGDPFSPKNRNSVFKLISEVRKRYGYTKDIWVWTGYTMYELNDMQLPINEIDVIVDGRFELDKRDVSLKFRGSSNQKIWYRVTSDGLWCTREDEDER